MQHNDVLACPLWVKSGHRSTSNQCLLYPQKRTSPSAITMSVLRQKQELGRLVVVYGSLARPRRQSDLDHSAGFR